MLMCWHFLPKILNLIWVVGASCNKQLQKWCKLTFLMTPFCCVWIKSLMHNPLSFEKISKLLWATFPIIVSFEQFYHIPSLHFDKAFEFFKLWNFFYLLHRKFTKSFWKIICEGNIQIAPHISKWTTFTSQTSHLTIW